jgi:hypothetical protein
MKAETCRYHKKHELKHILLIVTNESFVLWFNCSIYTYIGSAMNILHIIDRSLFCLNRNFKATGFCLRVKVETTQLD